MAESVFGFYAADFTEALGGAPGVRVGYMPAFCGLLLSEAAALAVALRETVLLAVGYLYHIPVAPDVVNRSGTDMSLIIHLRELNPAPCAVTEGVAPVNSADIFCGENMRKLPAEECSAPG